MMLITLSTGLAQELLGAVLPTMGMSRSCSINSKADRKTTFFGYQHSLKDIIMWEAILNHMVPLMTIYSQPIRPQFDLNKCGRGRLELEGRMVNNFFNISRSANISCSTPTKSTLLRRLLF